MAVSVYNEVNLSRVFTWFFAGGHCPDVGLGGFLLQGGMGWNCKV